MEKVRKRDDAEVVTIHFEKNMTVCSKFHDNLFKILVETLGVRVAKEQNSVNHKVIAIHQLWMSAQTLSSKIQKNVYPMATLQVLRIHFQGNMIVCTKCNAIHVIVVEVFQSEPKWWPTHWLTLPTEQHLWSSCHKSEPSFMWGEEGSATNEL